MLDAYGGAMGEDYFKSLRPIAAFHFMLLEDGGRRWFIQFVEDTPDESVYCADVVIDAKTGEVLSMQVGRGHG